ncbi:MAG: PHP domain-containing protein [Anaerovoracaceae bacterium]|nr:PHP domain-containing protein [Anaerovoracaceae bacterium]
MRVDRRTDYHLHTTYSDGVCTPEKVVKLAAENGLEVIAITDHDGTGGIAEALAAGEKYGVEVVPGIEFSTEFEGAGIHMLGYYIDPENAALSRKCRWILDKRENRNRRFIRQLNEDDLEITEDEIREGRDSAFIGKPVIAGALVRKGYFGSEPEVFDKIFSTERYKNIKKEKISTIEAMELIKGAGGKPVLAHPALIEDLGARGTAEFDAKVEDIVGRLVENGLWGLECYYADFSDEEVEKYAELADRYGLVKTRGSDFHGRGGHSRMFQAPRQRYKGIDAENE